MARYLFLAVVIAFSAGCLPRTTVVKDPAPHDRGVRYYRPKPYLFVRPQLLSDRSGVQDGYVELSIVQLPDYSEEYSIHVKSGLGTNNTQIGLTDGWNLTTLNVDIDSQFDENLTAASSLASALPFGANSIKGDNPSMIVRATNVPMGLYEAVISESAGQKRLYGFRYVGFMPYSACPIESDGVECHSCYDGQVFGLVFEDGAMVFRPLHEIPGHIWQRKNLDFRETDESQIN